MRTIFGSIIISLLFTRIGSNRQGVSDCVHVFNRFCYVSLSAISATVLWFHLLDVLFLYHLYTIHFFPFYHFIGTYFFSLSHFYLSFILFWALIFLSATWMCFTSIVIRIKYMLTGDDRIEAAAHRNNLRKGTSFFLQESCVLLSVLVVHLCMYQFTFKFYLCLFYFRCLSHFN